MLIKNTETGEVLEVEGRRAIKLLRRVPGLWVETKEPVKDEVNDVPANRKRRTKKT